MGENEITTTTEALEALEAVIEKLQDTERAYYPLQKAYGLRKWIIQHETGSF